MTALAAAEATPAAGHAPEADWTVVCRWDRLERERGVAAMVAGRQVAVFRTWDDGLYALDHLDPFSGAYVIARGIVGSRGDVPTVASPMYKQVFDMRTGVCLDDGSVSLQVHEARVADGGVEVRLCELGAAPGDLGDRVREGDGTT
jgi:nitrite reductase (NADH) small subunit